MKLTFHGGAREVGRSCVEVSTAEHRLLLDCGLKITPEDTEYPTGLKDPQNIDAVIISHAHLDHTGALPYFEHQGLRCPIYCTRTTKDLTRILLEDAFKVGKIQNHHLGYKRTDIKDVLKVIKLVKKKERGEIDGARFELIDAGHIPGSATIKLEAEGKKIIYTGDIKTEETRLHKGARLEFIEDEEIDILITESTYGDRDHTERTRTEYKFMEAVKETLDEGGSVIIPVFAVGRAQEILLILNEERIKAPIYLDGMGIRVTEAILKNPQSVKDAKKLERAFNRAKKIRSRQDRAEAIRRGGIFVTTSGMLTGGPVLHYLNAMNHSNNAILLTGYQGEETNGRLLLETGEVFIEGMKKIVRCKVKQFDFSAHDGMSQIKNTIRTIRPKKVIFMHGDEEPINNLLEWAKAKGIEAYAPKIGETITIR